MYKIGMFDSGIGGLKVLDEVKELMPYENIIYYKDTSNNPYGNKSDDELRNITSNIVDSLLTYGVKEIIVACNTATTRCVSYLRDKYKDVIFIGTEPAVKVATDNNFKNILVMATPGTINSKRLHDLVNLNKKSDENIYLEACEGLANSIEFDDVDKIDEIVNNIYNSYKDKNIDAIVLGCTHYYYIKDKLKSLFKESELIDGNKGVAREARRRLEINNLLSVSNDDRKITIIES